LILKNAIPVRVAIFQISSDLIDLDNYCETDADCKRPKVCRLVCRRDCKSVCVHVVDEVNDSLGGRGGGGSFDAIWWTKKPDSAVTSRRKLWVFYVQKDIRFYRLFTIGTCLLMSGNFQTPQACQV
jgi:hypothetical protein